MTNKDNPRIMHVILTLGVGGAEQLVYRMATDGLSKGTSPVICCLLFLGELGEEFERRGGSIYCRHHQGGIDLGIVSWLRRIIIDEGVGAVHAHTYSPLFYAVPAALLAGGVKVIFTEHGRLYPECRSFKRSLFNPLLALGTRQMVSISESTSEAMHTYDNFPRRRIRVIHNGIAVPPLASGLDLIEKRRSLGVSETARIVGTAARLEKIKNLPMMLRAFRHVVREVPEAVLLIAGHGSKEQELKRMAEDLELSSNVNFVGLRSDLWEIYQLMEVFLLSSFTEGISVTLLEAMASGVPAVVTAVGGNPEVVVDAVTGYLVPLDDDLAMAERVVGLLRDRKQAETLGKKGQERVEKEFSFDNMMRSYHALYTA